VRAVSDGPVKTERRDQVLVVTIDRPEARNAIDAATAEGIGRAMEQLDEDDGLRVGVLTGTGNFSAGMDLKAFVRGEAPYYADRGFAGLVERPPEKPLVAAVESYALAGGFEIALACDLIVAARDARFGIPEVKRSLVAAAGALLHLSRYLPPAAAGQLALTGEPIGAERAYALGLVSRLAEPGEALAAAIDLAETIARNGPLAVAASKRILREAPGWPEDERWRRQLEIVGPVIASEDAREGAVAFAEKRDPQWKGR
jgi:enoyl-CoA hydratase